MKKFLLTFILAALFLFGCSDVGVNPKVPVNNNQVATTLNKTTDFDNGGQSHEKFSMHFINPFFISKKINGKEGGVISLKGSWDFGGTSATVTFPPNSFKGSRRISIVINPLDASISFYPHMVFNKTVELDLSFKGLDLQQLNLDPGQVHFYCEASSGQLSPVSNSGLNINMEHGSLEVVNAQLQHFSRYLFAR